MNVNLAAYDYKYGNLQVGAVPPSPPGVNPAVTTINAAKAKIYGVDFDVTYLAMEGLIVRGGLNYNHARYSKFDNATCWTGQTQALGCNLALVTNPTTGVTTGFAQDLTGQPLVRAPDWQGIVGFTYQRPVGNNGMTLIIDSSNRFSSKYPLTLSTRTDAQQKAYLKADLVVTLKGPKDRWEVSLAGRNLNNRYTIGGCSIANDEGTPLQVIPSLTGGATSGTAGLGEAHCYADPGRTVTLTFTWRPVGGG